MHSFVLMFILSFQYTRTATQTCTAIVCLFDFLLNVASFLSFAALFVWLVDDGVPDVTYISRVADEEENLSFVTQSQISNNKKNTNRKKSSFIRFTLHITSIFYCKRHQSRQVSTHLFVHSSSRTLWTSFISKWYTNSLCRRYNCAI